MYDVLIDALQIARAQHHREERAAMIEAGA